MLVLVPVAALLIGVLIARLIGFGPVTGINGQYLAIGCLAGLDSIAGGIRAGLEGKFANDTFITGFVFNVAAAFFLTWLGDQIGINLLLAAVVILGGRVFTNLSLIRRFLLTRWQDNLERKKQAVAQSKTT
ncbi:MAG: small basic family protein [Fimbriimonadaceae bacterium]